MREKVNVWASRAHMTTGAFYLAVGMALLCSFLAGFNVILWNKTRTQDQQIAILVAQRDAEKKASQQAKIVEVKAQHARCKASIKSTMIANTVIVSFKKFLVDTANDTEAVIKAEPDSPANGVREQIVKDRRTAAAQLSPFPTLTQEQCNETSIMALADLGVGREKAKRILGVKDA